ncbi:MAG: DUF2946 family protein [Solirubrobacterales bacterium]
MILSWLCLLAIVVNLSAPLTMIAAAGADALNASICHSSGSEQPSSDQSPASKPGTANCPLCLLFSGTIWAPPTVAAVPVQLARSVGEVIRPAQPDLPGRASVALRPASRAPPVSA